MTKTMKTLRKRISVKIVNNKKDYLKHTGKPIFFLQKYLKKIMLLLMN